MRNWKKRLFFWTLVVLFFLVAPSIVLYAKGFRFDRQRGVFVHGGAINIKSNPQSVDVTLNGKLIKSKKLNRINSSYNISGLVPGDYEIKVLAEGFNVWDKKIDVHSDISSEFWNVVLARKDYAKISYDAPQIDRFFTSPKNNYIAYNQDSPKGLSIALFDLSEENQENSFFFPEWKFLSASRKENLEWSPQEDYLSIPAEKDAAAGVLKNRNNPSPGTEYAYFIAETQSKNTFNLNELLGKKDIGQVRWDPKEKDFLFFLSEGNLFRANIKNRTVDLISPEVSGFDLSGSRVYWAKTGSNLIFRSSLDGTSDENQITNSFLGDEEIKNIVVYDDDRIAVLTQNKNLYIYNKGDRDTYFRKIGENAEEAHFSDDGKKLLFWTNNEISVYFVRDWLVQPMRNENDLLDITRYSIPVKNAQWFKDYEHVIFSTERFVKVVELDSRDHINSMDLISTTLETPFVIYNSYLERLYFTDVSSDNSLKLNYIIFPEKTPLLGIGG